MDSPLPLPLEGLTASFFQSHLGADFLVAVPGVPGVTLRLMEAETLNMRGTNSRDPFRLRFEGSPERVLPQQVYELANPLVGRLAIFIVPIGRDANVTSYEAIFT
jgi:hypothetical protein